ncbi:class C beta-lactamase [Collimonas fungivorans]|uniref:Beta-lactamase n=1 Tax=Collimonas fungivorans (strain Ter331) TaxID=1005048 RepID=G0AAQ2_COLFT|nr:class C beta-lactamase [Collimonas fungivorans]AEK63346.1 Beta-lactamase [Collimonas fungivorans Ter331]
MSILKVLSFSACFLVAGSCAGAGLDQSGIKTAVDSAIQPLMQSYAIPGMAVAVTIDGKNYFFNYGVASKETRQPVTNRTLFEIGSLSKTFTATLASYAQVDGKLSLSDSASKYLPSLGGSSFDNISLLNLGTHTAGGLPLQVPDDLGNTGQLMDYFKHWQPAHAAGTYRKYSNPSIGLLGMIAAKSMDMSFDDAIEKKLFPELGMTHSYINVPAGQMKDYAQGYTTKDVPVRVNPGVLASEAYGVKSGSADLIRFIGANMQAIKLEAKLQRAITDTHTGYFVSGEFTQDLIWEQYPYPLELKRLLAGNATTALYDELPAARLNPALPPQADVLINKTGSTNGFSSYAAFVPAKKIGIVILANKSYPIDQRVTAAYRILTRLDSEAASKN